jgi:hypothetical protein
MRKDGVYGFFTMGAVKEFQRDRGIKPVDGVVGRKTMEALFLQRIRKRAVFFGVPPKYMCGQIIQESGYDPAATGFIDPNDRGWVQINFESHPDIPDEKAFFADYALDYGAKRMHTAFNANVRKLGGDPHPQNAETDYGLTPEQLALAWKCAIAQHNSPADANAWLETGEPPDEQIEQYVAKISTHCTHDAHHLLAQH